MSMDTPYLTLVNRAHPLARRPAPEELVPALPGSPDVLLLRPAARALRALLADIGAGEAIVPVSGWRSREEQEALWEGSLRDHGLAFTETYVARPGCSEHETGLAIDLGENVPGLDFIRPSFPDHGICGRCRARAADFGFLLRYPRGKEAVTGIGWEPWHFRYVGTPWAREIAGRGLTLEEYLHEA